MAVLLLSCARGVLLLCCGVVWYAVAKLCYTPGQVRLPAPLLLVLLVVPLL